MNDIQAIKQILNLSCSDEKAMEIFAKQDESTKMRLMATEAERIEYWSSPIPKEAQVLKEDGSVDINVRNVTEEEYDVVSRTRRRAGARIEEMRAPEDRVMRVVPSDEKRERAEMAFLGKLKSVTQRFKDMMGSIFKPSHAEIVAQAMKENMNEE